MQIVRIPLPASFALVAALALGACGEGGRRPATDLGADLAGGGGEDLAGADLSAGPDLAGVDLATPPMCNEAADGGAGPGDRCADPIPLTPGVGLTNQANTSFTDDYDPGANVSAACASELTASYNGKDAAYSITIPPGQTLTVTVQHSQLNGVWYPAVAMVTDCCRPGPTCLSAQDVVIPNSEPRVVSHTNNTGAPLPVFILVDSDFASAMGEGSFSITATLN